MIDSKKTLMGRFRSTFLRGIGVIIPLGLTFWVFQSLLNAIDGILMPLLIQAIGRHIPGLGFLSMIVIILLVGLLTRNLVGRLAFAWFENLLKSIPFVRAVYGGIKDLVSAFNIGGQSRTFRDVVMIEFPRKGLYCIGFVTNEMQYQQPDGSIFDFVNVYVHNPPNPTSGFLSLVPKSEAIVLKMSIEDGLKLVLSGGIVVPDRITALHAAP